MSPFVLKIKCIDFFVLHRGFLHMTLFLGMLQALFFQEFEVSGFMDVCASYEGFYWGVKSDL